MRWRKQRNKASIMVLTAGMIMFLLLLMAFAVSLGLLGLAHAQLDGATDAASHAGATAGAKAWHSSASGTQVIVQKQQAVPAAQQVWNANQHFIGGVSNASVKFNKNGYLSEDREYGQAQFWANSIANYQNPYMQEVAGLSQRTIHAEAETVVHAK